MSLALHLGRKFSVISVLANTASWVEIQALKFGVERRLASAIGIEIPVLELENSPDRTVAAIVAAAQEAIARHGAEVIILGCTGMAALASAVRERLSVPVIEPAAAAVKLAELLVSLGLRHHRGRTYLPPSPDKIRGC
jgi:allantoin racemase